MAGKTIVFAEKTISATLIENQDPVHRNLDSGKGNSVSAEGNQPGGKGKGKGKGKGQNPSQNRSRSSRESTTAKQSAQPDRNSDNPKLSLTLFCKFCKKKGHYEDFRWAKQKMERQQKKKTEKSTAGPNLANPQTISDTTPENTSSKKRKAEAMSLLQGTKKTSEQLSPETQLGGHTPLPSGEGGRGNSLLPSLRCISRTFLLKNKLYFCWTSLTLES